MLASLLGLYQIPIQPAQLRHQAGHDRPFTPQDVVRLARQKRGVRCRAVSAQANELSGFPLPVLADGPEGWFLIGRTGDTGVMIQRPGRQAELCRWDRLETIWSGTLVLLTTRHSPETAAPAFDASWFIPQLVRYRHLIGEVLLITLALNLLGLAAPLFFQNVIDKVVVYNSASTLAVLVIGFVAASIWEVALGWLRTRLYSETSQKIDVELGARLFSHLMRLPLTYFESRRVGDTVARVRLIEAIREFMTSASLSVLVDPLFALIFVSAMWFYAPRLLLVVLATLPLYAAVSVLATGPLRRLLAEKFERGAASNAFLVESVSTVETIKSAAIEPLWQQQWEQQLAGYSGANQRVINLASTSTQLIQLINKLGMAALL
jgi:ATP-binding cassette, subfamily B, bacterial HlyB/CyaB